MDLPHIHAVGMTCRDAIGLAGWYERWLGFTAAAPQDHRADAYGELLGLPGSHLLRLPLRLGEETLELLQVLDPGPGARPGRPLPADSRSTDLWFQHICLVTADLAAVAAPIEAQIAAGELRPISTRPQRLPDWNVGAAGIVAFKVHDPDGHPLELLQFPPDKGDARWHRGGGPGPLGLDHSAIGSADPDRSARFYGELLGMRCGGDGTNSGPEQDGLDGVTPAVVQIGSWRAAQGMGIETLAYRSPAGGRPMPADHGAQDLAHWQIRLEVSDPERIAARLGELGLRPVSAGVIELGDSLPGFRRGLQLSDPDGHRLQLLAR